jgi:hypothetical protein
VQGIHATGGILKHYEVERDSSTTIALAAAVGLGAGILAGIVVGEMLGAVHPARLRGVVERFGRQPTPQLEDPRDLEQAILEALSNNAATRMLNLSARVIDGGLVELTGVAPDDRTRRLAGATASGAAGGAVVVNRILVEGRDVPPGPSAPATGVS